MDIILIDDEIQALNRLKRMAEEIPGINVAGAFTKPARAIDFVRANHIDAALLDIEMPGINGMELADIITETEPSVRVVFVTAYDSYAIQAFKIHAAGYLLKPVAPADLREQLELLMKNAPAANGVQNASGKLKVKCFGDFRCWIEGENGAHPVKWKTLKAEELFALFIHNRGNAVPKEVLIDALWPDAEPQKSANLFRVTCTYIRNTMSDAGLNDILVRELNNYRFDISDIECDYFDFEDAAADMSSLSKEKLTEAIALYDGEYMRNAPYDWLLTTRTWLDNKFKEMAKLAARAYIAAGDVNNACETLYRVMLNDPYDSAAAAMIITLKKKSGEYDEAVRFYRAYADRLLRDTGDMPPENLIKLFD